MTIADDRGSRAVGVTRRRHSAMVRCAGMVDIELAGQSSELMRARAEAWQRFIRVVNGGPATKAVHSGPCDHDRDLLGKCRLCGEQVPA